jgi:dienelactone hydrolase
MMDTREHHYELDGLIMTGFVANDAAIGGKKSGVLVAHAFGGLGDFERETARRLASLGYVGFAIDYYGHGRRAASAEEAGAWMRDLEADRSALRQRVVRAHEQLAALPEVDRSRTAAIGFCFGGKAVLDLARSGATLAAVIPFHGVYDRPPGPMRRMNTSVLVLHGWDDPLAPPDALRGLAEELTQTCEDWQILAFGHTYHAFTNPAAAMPERGLAFHVRSSARAWQAMAAHLEERFGERRRSRNQEG